VFPLGNWRIAVLFLTHRIQNGGSHARQPKLRLAVAGLCLAFFLQGLLASRIKSPTFDETTHIVSGATYIATGHIVANPEHPPLLKELAGLSLALAGIRWQDKATPQELEGRPAGWEKIAGVAFVAGAGVGRTLFWARLPLLLLSPLLGLLIYCWGRELADARAGLCALFLFAADPTMVAHSYLVTTDVGVATFSLLFLLALFRYLRKPGAGRLVIAGAALGLALCAKFSAIFLGPIAAVLLLAAFLRPPSPEDTTRPTGTGASMVSAVLALAAMSLVALLVIQIVYLSPRGPFLYRYGLSRVYANSDPNFLAYLGGHLKHRFASYFAVAWLVKEPLATILLALGGTFLVLRSRVLDPLSKLFLFLPPAVFFVACTFWASDIGFRYVIPALPFGYLAGGIALAALLKGRALHRAVAAAACVWVVLAAAGIYPDHLSYFNEAACLPDHPERIGLDGGSRCGPEWLADSNVDWGGSLPQLKTWLDRNASERPVRLAYFGKFPPEAYGIRYEAVSPIILRLPSRGRYVISAHILTTPDGIDWLSDEPLAVVGHAYYIYDIDF
jgi:hypothetical protein